MRHGLISNFPSCSLSSFIAASINHVTYYDPEFVDLNKRDDRGRYGT